MKILLFNDNPVVRKLVALSAQKTKDELSVVWSVDEIEGSEYDLLIMDDALYSDDTFESLNNRIDVKSKLLMATRGNAVPDGFDHVINKPFLPTDLVDLLIHIEKKEAGSNPLKESTESSPPVYSINLEDALPELESSDMQLHEMQGFDDEEFDFGGLDEIDEKLPETSVLDKEEVQEVQGLLEDAESAIDDIIVEDIHAPESDDHAIMESMDEIDFDDVSETKPIEEEFDFEGLLGEEALENAEETTDKAMLDEEEFGAIELPSDLEDANTFDETALLGEEPIEFGEEPMDEETALPEELDFDDSMLEEMDLPELGDEDNYLDALEAKINDAVSGLKSEDLEQELSPEDLDESLMADLDLDLPESEEVGEASMNGLDELDMLDELELKRAIGEEVKEESFDAQEEFSDTIESVDKEDDAFEEVSDKPAPSETSAAHPEGVEALQALLKALSNEDVAKSLKGMNISININFGNGA
ncbi:MAG: hypothetical protein JHC35_06080 [Sulfuricurvum sp.]|jgi:uncharacterized membrane protein|uniref:hypothetical protein n=1 Tax=Sulfuricurvum sp. TaxID=2025608 RepID=UPI0025E3895E|nr:hypothetical protein [Sulfuricurvum sp.]MCI4406837.1 hypothetical protein [Sulfuricurvum sp.]